jgi:hypothetical protein
VAAEALTEKWTQFRDPTTPVQLEDKEAGAPISGVFADVDVDGFETFVAERDQGLVVSTVSKLADR